MRPPEIYIKDFQYPLPVDRIAAYPLAERDQSKMLIYQNGEIRSNFFKNLADYLPENASLVLNNTRVIEARILFKKASGGTIEIFCLDPADNLIHTADVLQAEGKVLWNCLIGSASKWKHGEVLQKQITIEPNKLILRARYVEKNVDSFIIEFTWEPATYHFFEVLHAAGNIPLPPYIKREPVEIDAERYQTIFARIQGSVAAPTAALHFTKTVFDGLKNKNISTDFITLHVGAGTFKPVKTETVSAHQMHLEEFQVSITTLKNLVESKEIIAVGTTSLRALESLYWIGVKIKRGMIGEDGNITLEQWEAYELGDEKISYSESIDSIIVFLKRMGVDVLLCQTSLLIVPGYNFHSAKALITNFHQSQSTLLLLVAAFIGEDWKMVYDYALKNDFRFLSYGDSSLLWKKN